MDEVDELVNQLKGRKPEERRRSAVKLGTLGAAAEKALPALVDALGDPVTEFRRLAGLALTAIGRVGPKAAKALPALIKTAKDDHPDILDAARAAVGSVQPK